MRCRVRTDAGIEHVPSLGVSRADHDARDGVKYLHTALRVSMREPRKPLVSHSE